MTCRLVLRLGRFGCRPDVGLIQGQQRLMCTDAQGVYSQGQSPEPRVREYFYYLDHQGQLFLDDTKIKNFVTCFKDSKFLVFFFNRLRLNHFQRYDKHFPYVSLCGRERNFLRCDDQPTVFTHLLPPSAPSSPSPTTGEITSQPPNAELTKPIQEAMLSYCGGGAKLALRFQPEALYMRPASGRLYHPGPERAGGVGLVRSALAIELSSNFVYREGGEVPTHFVWEGQEHTLTNELAELLPEEDTAEGAEI